MMGRTPDARTFPAVLLAFASLSTPALGATPGDTEAAGAIASAPGGTVVGDAAPVERESEDSGISAALALLAPTEDLVRRGEVLPDGVGDVLSTVDVAAGEAVLDEHAGDGEGASRTGAVDLSTHGDTVTLDSRLLHNLRGDFVARLERVAERMWDQHGMRVELVEGYRTPERQQALFAQGRTTDGPVVTWTRNSLHSVGAAADVFVDGSPVTPEEAALLARVAREEGLRTLHPFDSGHIQMEGVGSRGGPESALPRELPSAPAGPSLPKGVAPVAPVAQPARPARPGGPVLEDLSADLDAAERAASAEADGGPGSTRRQSPAEVVRTLMASKDDSSGASQLDRVRAGLAERGAMRVREEGRPDRAEARAGVDVAPGHRTGRGSPTVTDIESGLSALQPERAAHGTAAPRGDASGRPMVPTLEPAAHMARFEGANGAVYRRVHVPIDGLGGPASLHVGVRGGAVDAALTLSDPLLATELRENLHELRQTLASRGVEAGGMAIRVAPEGIRAASSTVELVSATTSEVSGTTSTSEGRSGDSKHHGSRQGQPQLTDEWDDGPLPRRRDDRSRRNLEEK